MIGQTFRCERDRKRSKFERKGPNRTQLTPQSLCNVSLPTTRLTRVPQDHPSSISSMADRDPILTVDKKRSEAFLSNGMDQQQAEATSNTRHWASRDTTSSGTRIHNTLSHDACSSRPLSGLSPVFAASV